jgi:hypothetical protein
MKWQWWLAVVWLAVAGCDGPGAQPVETGRAERVQAETGGERIVAQRAAEKLLAPLLVAPASAVYPWEEIASEQVPCDGPGRAWRVQGVVDAKNESGVPLRHKWQAFIFERDGELCPIYLEMEGQVVFGSVTALVEAGIAKTGAIEEPAPEPEAMPTPPVEVREWTDASGRFRVSAKFAGLAFGKVKLEREGGQVIEIEAEKLSQEDREWIRARR